MFRQSLWFGLGVFAVVTATVVAPWGPAPIRGGWRGVLDGVEAGAMGLAVAIVAAGVYLGWLAARRARFGRGGSAAVVSLGLGGLAPILGSILIAGLVKVTQAIGSRNSLASIVASGALLFGPGLLAELAIRFERARAARRRVPPRSNPIAGGDAR